MKNNIKIFLIALVLGMLVSYIYCTKFDNTILTKAIESKVTYFYIGSYNNELEAENKSSRLKNSLIYNDNGIYKVIIGVYKNKDSIELMTSYFNDLGITFYKSELKINNEFIKTLSTYEALIKTNTKDNYYNINSYILKSFNEYIN